MQSRRLERADARILRPDVRFGIERDDMALLGMLLHCLRIVLKALRIVGERDSSQVFNESSDPFDRETVRTCNYISLLRKREKVGAVGVAHGPRVIAVKEEPVFAVTLELLSADDLLAVNGLLEEHYQGRDSEVQTAREPAPDGGLREISVIRGKLDRADIGAGKIVIERVGIVERALFHGLKPLFRACAQLLRASFPSCSCTLQALRHLPVSCTLPCRSRAHRDYP